MTVWFSCKVPEDFLEENFLICPHHGGEDVKNICNSSRSRIANLVFFSEQSLHKN